MEDLRLELEQKDEEIKELKDIIKGTIRESGTYKCSIYGNWKWNINYSSILTKLIQETGRWCEHYASDLFIIWKAIEDDLKNREIENKHYVFAFRNIGVDGTFAYEINKDKYHYYRAVWFLDLEVVDDKLTMILHK